MATRPRSQHYLPEFHLAQFIGLPFRRFHVFDKKWGKFGRPPVAKSAFSRDYYLLPGQTDEERLRLERQFALLEDQVAPLMKWLAVQPPGPVQIDDQDRDALAGYAAILHIRVPAFRVAAWERALSMGRDPEILGLADSAEFRGAARKMGFPGTDEDLEVLRMAWLEDIQTGRRRIEVHRGPAAGRRHGDAPRGHRGLLPHRPQVVPRGVRASGVAPRTYVGDLERGERNVGLANIGRIAEGLGCTVPALMAEAERRLPSRPR